MQEINGELALGQAGRHSVWDCRGKAWGSMALSSRSRAGARGRCICLRADMDALRLTESETAI